MSMQEEIQIANKQNSKNSKISFYLSSGYINSTEKMLEIHCLKYCEPEQLF